MVLCAIITRASDGLPLAASTDLDVNKELKESRLYVKALSKKVCQLPDRCSLQLGHVWIHFIVSLGVCFMTLCEEKYPTVLAFCFLDEIQREFIVNYDRRKVENVVRPYTFIEFDTFIQKAKQRYVNTRSLSTKINLSDMSTEMKLRPPYKLSLEEVGIGNSNGVESRHLYRPKPISKQSLIPMNWLSYLSFALNILCALLNFGRAMTIILFGPVSLDDDAFNIIKYILVFLLSSCLCVYQCYLQLVFVRRRTLKGLVACFFLLCCNFYVTSHRYRYMEAFVFNCIVAVLAVTQIRARGLPAKSPDYNV
ncbi:vesicle-trafficking protein SEC22a-like [Glandiceps talaboti]